MIACFTLLSGTLTAQRFETEVQALMAKQLSADPHPILFIGSSSFTRWPNIQDYFPGYHIVNRAFGGSTLTDQITYAHQLIYTISPRQIVVYCGENDLAEDSLVDGKTVYKRFKILYNLIKKKFSQIPVIYISMKPSPSRMHIWPKMKSGNRLIKRMAFFRKQLLFTDVTAAMMLSGQPDPSIFEADQLHMNKKGYAIWQKILTPLLINDLSCKP